LLEEFDIINTYISGKTDDLEGLVKAVYEKGKKDRVISNNHLIISKSTDQIIVVVSTQKNFIDLQNLATKALRKNSELLDEFLEYFEGLLFDNKEDVDVES
jgi:hypothetical protein